MSREVCTSVLTPERGVGSDEMRTPEDVVEMRRLRGFGGLPPVRPLLRHRRKSRGFEGGRSLPSPEPSVRTLGRLAHDQVGLPTLVLRLRIDDRLAVYSGSRAPRSIVRHAAHCSMSTRRHSNRSERR